MRGGFRGKKIKGITWLEELGTRVRRFEVNVSVKG